MTLRQSSSIFLRETICWSRGIIKGEPGSSSFVVEELLLLVFVDLGPLLLDLDWFWGERVSLRPVRRPLLADFSELDLFLGGTSGPDPEVPSDSFKAI